MSSIPPPAPSTRSRLFADIAVSVTVAVVVFGGIQWWQARDAPAGLPLGQPPPDFTLTDGRTGKTVRLGDLRGRPTVLNFWATWCAPCRAEMPEFDRLSQVSGNQLHVVTITADDPLLVKQFLDARGYDLPCLMDATGTVSQRYRVDALPRTVVLDTKGDVVWDVVGAVDMTTLLDTLRAVGY